MALTAPSLASSTRRTGSARIVGALGSGLPALSFLDAISIHNTQTTIAALPPALLAARKPIRETDHLRLQDLGRRDAVSVGKRYDR